MKPRSLFHSAGAALAPLLTREQAKALADRVLAMSTADETRVTIDSAWEGNTRFAGGEITTSGEAVNTTVGVSTTIGKRRAAANTNVLDDASLRRTVDLAIRLARLSPEDPELMPELGAQNYVNVNGWIDTTANLGPEARAAAVASLISSAQEVGRPAGDAFVAGYLEATAGARAIANNRGMFAYHRSTGSDLSNTVRTPDRTGSGWASSGARDWAAIDPAALGARAAQKAVASRNPQAIEPGAYTVVLEPGAVADLVPQLAGAFNARNADEGRSAFSKRGGGNLVGEKVADERVSLYSDPADAELLAQPFDTEGVPISRRVWIEKGILKNLSYSRFWAQKQGVAPTGGGGGGGGGGGFGGGLPGGLKMVGGTKTTEELIAGVRRGILVNHVFY